MNRIKINEADYTTNEVVVSSGEVVYIPGFALKGNIRKPTLCTSIAEFTSIFGEHAPTFMSDQLYIENDGTSSGFGFTELAIPKVSSSEAIMYTSGNQDPSFVMAKELIAKGLSVVYERVNTASSIPNFDNFKGDWSGKIGYSVNDYVSHINTSNKMAYFKCTTAIDAPAEGSVNVWDSTKWTEDTSLTYYDVTVQRMYEAMTGTNLEEDEVAIYANDIPGALSEISTFDIKYITSGGYPTYEFKYGSNMLCQDLATLAATRGDAVAFIDHTNNETRPLTGDASVFGSIGSSLVSDTTDSFATMITPWATCDTIESSEIQLPGSFFYLSALANAIKTYPSWLPIAGVSRGILPGVKSLSTKDLLSNAVADSYQHEVSGTTGGVSINAITKINNYGYCIWGNRTAKPINSTAKAFATSFLNMRNLVCDVKKKVYAAAQRLMFEQNNDILWLNFKSDVATLLDKMVSGNVLRNYKLIKLSSEDKTKISAKILLYPVYAVESFEITIILTDDELSVD